MYCHLNHDISLLSKVICVSIFWDVATGCYCNMHFPPSQYSLLLPGCDIHQQFASFLPPSSSVSPSGNLPAPLANRRRNMGWFLCLVLMKQLTTLPSFQADHLQINLLLYMPCTSDLCKNPYHEANNRESYSFDTCITLLSEPLLDFIQKWQCWLKYRKTCFDYLRLEDFA